MELAERLFKVPVWRSHSFPYAATSLTVVCHGDDVPFLGTTLRPHHAAVVRAVVLLDDPAGSRGRVTCEIPGAGPVAFPVDDVASLSGRPEREVLVFGKEFEYFRFLHASRLLEEAGVGAFYLAMPYGQDVGVRTAFRPAFYQEHEPALRALHNALADEESRNVLAGRVRAIVTGNVGYLPLARYPQYFHPVVHPRPGDVIMDGGVSEYVESQVAMATAAGPEGRVVGFEPDPPGFLQAEDLLLRRHALTNYTLLPLGMWNKPGTLRFVSSGVGSHMAGGGEADAVEVPVTSIDVVARKLGLPRVDFIKMDVEGAELNALRGSMETILAHSPRLAISVYHTLEDLFLIPQVVQRINPAYRFYLGHHHPCLFDTVLYATVE